MPLRSVEAATREDAIAAAREQFGPSARVIGVRRVRSGGVLGFFTTERYVAEVEPAPARRSIGAPSRDAGAGESSVAERAAHLAAFLQQQESEQRVEEIAELFSAGTTETEAPTYSRASFQRPSAPRPAAAPSAPAAPVRATTDRSPAGWAPSPSFPTAATSFPTAPTSFAAAPEEPADAGYSPASFARALRNVTDMAGRGSSPILREEPAEPATPSPFTAALARMVAGDREVRQAVQDALDGQLAGDSGTHEGPWTAGTPRVEPIETTTGAEHRSTGAQHQEEKPVSQLETTTGASPTGQPLPTWAAAPTAATASREDAIAQILRTALAQNHSDDALADILRKVLADASTAPAPAAAPATAPVPAAAAPAPAASPEPAWREAEPLWGPAPSATAWPTETGLPTTPVAFVEPVREYAEVPDDVVVPIDLGVPAPAPVPMPTAPMPVATPDTVAAETPAIAEIAEDEPIWAEVVLHEPAPAQEAPGAPTAATAATLAEAIRAQIMGESAVVEQPPVAEPMEAPAADVPAEQQIRAEEQAAPEQVGDAVQATGVESDYLLADDAVVETAAAEEAAAAESASFAMPELARTASDPAPLPADATTVMPALSLLPPLPGARRGSRPPVPPPSRPAAPPSRPAAEEEPAEAPEALATVTMLPVVAMAEPEPSAEASIDETADDVAIDHVEPQLPPAEDAAPMVGIGEPTSAVDEYVAAVEALIEPAVAVPTDEIRATLSPVADEQPADVVSRLRALGIPQQLLGSDFAADAEARGTYAALTSSLARRLPEPPVLPTGAGEVLFVVGPGVATLRAARSLAASLGLHPDCVQWASRGELVGLAPKNFRMSTIDDALDRRQEAVGCGTVTIVAVDAPLRSDAYWMGQMLAVWTPVAVWAVVEATRKPEDLGEWLDALPRVDALVLQDTDLSADPAAVLERVSMPVALLDGVRATPHRWASLLCERLESDRA